MCVRSCLFVPVPVYQCVCVCVSVCDCVLVHVYCVTGVVERINGGGGDEGAEAIWRKKGNGVVGVAEMSRKL